MSESVLDSILDFFLSDESIEITPEMKKFLTQDELRAIKRRKISEERAKALVKAKIETQCNAYVEEKMIAYRAKVKIEKRKQEEEKRKQEEEKRKQQQEEYNTLRNYFKGTIVFDTCIWEEGAAKKEFFDISKNILKENGCKITILADIFQEIGKHADSTVQEEKLKGKSALGIIEDFVDDDLVFIEDAAFEYNDNKLFADEKIYEFAKKCDAQKKECIIFTNDRPLRTSIKCSFDNDTIKTLSLQNFSIFDPKLPAPPEIMIDPDFFEAIESEKYRREWYEQNGLEYFGI